MKLHHIPVVILIVSGVVMGLMTFLTDFGDNYGTNVDLTGLEGTETRLEQQQENAQDLSDEITSFKLESVADFFNIPYKMLKIAWKSARNMFNSWLTVSTMITETGGGLDESGIPLPGWLVPTLISIVIMILVAIIVYGFFKWRMED